MTTYDTAREVFNTYAALDYPDLPPDPMSALQLRLARWQTRNFGAGQLVHVALGIGEEVGEFLEACSSSARLDAIADINIYGFNTATLLRLDYYMLLQRGLGVSLSVPYALPVAVGRLQHAVLKNAQNIRGMGDQEVFRQAAGEALGKIGHYTQKLHGKGFWENIRSTAEEVMKRDWVAERAAVVRDSIKVL